VRAKLIEEKTTLDEMPNAQQRERVKTERKMTRRRKILCVKCKKNPRLRAFLWAQTSRSLSYTDCDFMWQPNTWIFVLEDAATENSIRFCSMNGK
jgi:hypothetical protein